MHATLHLAFSTTSPTTPPTPTPVGCWHLRRETQRITSGTPARVAEPPDPRVWAANLQGKKKKVQDLHEDIKCVPIPLGFPHSSVGKESACSAGELGLIPGSGRSPEKEMATHSSVLAWRMPWTEGPGGLQSIVLQSRR